MIQCIPVKSPSRRARPGRAHGPHAPQADKESARRNNGSPKATKGNRFLENAGFFRRGGILFRPRRWPTLESRRSRPGDSRRTPQMGGFEANRFSPRARAEQDSAPPPSPSPWRDLFRLRQEFRAAKRPDRDRSCRGLSWLRPQCRSPLAVGFTRRCPVQFNGSSLNPRKKGDGPERDGGFWFLAGRAFDAEGLARGGGRREG